MLCKKCQKEITGEAWFCYWCRYHQSSKWRNKTVEEIKIAQQEIQIKKSLRTKKEKERYIDHKTPKIIHKQNLSYQDLKPSLVVDKECNFCSKKPRVIGIFMLKPKRYICLECAFKLLSPQEANLPETTPAKE